MDDKDNFIAQRQKVKDLTPLNCGFNEDQDKRMQQREEIKKRNRNFKGMRPDFFIQEHLTRTNSTLLKETKRVAGSLGYQYPGYFMGGEVRCRNVEGGRYTVIECFEDLKKLHS